MSNRKLSRKEKILIKASEKPLNRSSSIQMTSTGWKLPLLLAIISFILYANTLGHGFVLDDYSLILENRITKMGTSAIPEIFQTGYRSGYFMKDDGLYRPLVKSMFAAEWQWGGGSPLLFHWINVLLYSFTGFFLYGMLLRLTRGNVFVAFVSSLLFICHPIHTEVVANIKSRDEILAFLFCILSLDYIFKWTVSRSTTSLLVSAFFFFLGLLSKESAITFLAVVPLSFWVFSDQSFLKNIKGLLPLILVTLLFLLMRSHALNGHGFTLNPNIADNLLSATTNPVEKFSTAVLILGLYLKLLLVPHPLVFDYSFNQIPIIGPGSFGFLISFISFLVLAAVAVKKIPCKSVLSFCVLYFFVTISVASNIFFLTGSSMGERFVYMPSLGYCMGVAFLIFTLFKVSNLQNDESRIFKGTSLKAMLLVLGIVSLFSLKVVARNPVWKDNFTLYSNDV